MKVGAMYFGFVFDRRMTDAMFLVRRMQEDFRDTQNRLYVCFVNNEKAFDRV